MKPDPGQFRVWEGAKVESTEWQTRVEPLFDAKADYGDQLDKYVTTLSRLQQLSYAANSHALLVIVRAMDAADPLRRANQATAGLRAGWFQGAAVLPA